MISHIVEVYFRENRIAFRNETRNELTKATLFLGGGCFAFSLAGLLTLTASGSSVGAFVPSLAFLAGGAVLVAIAVRRQPKWVTPETYAADEIFVRIDAAESVPPKTKRRIAVHLKRHGYVTYGQLLAFGLIDEHEREPQARRSASGARTLVSKLDAGVYGR